ncbi:MAG: DegT/DnrJ/EryC1/StrS family aminotransferase [Hyphomicrobium sp.]|uniref:DegT/DnrJ/EryC1/StrS family aminotransferase n=1 Tax=Hyphomicrobium sp. TaxID=82 RepID=UPI003D11E100
MIPFLDLKAQYAAIGPDLEKAAVEALRSGEFVLGSKVAAFEKNFATYCGAKEAIAVNTGTSALHLALLALDVGPGDEVITVSMTFVATVAAIRYTGAKPVMVDIDPVTWTMDPGQLEHAITPRTKAIVPVHLHGRLADMSAILAIAEKHGLPVVEDACQAHGAEQDGRRAGAFGTIGCFSFYPGKNLGACGEGGGIVTDRADIATRLRQMRDWGQSARYYHDYPGFNYRMDGVQGAMLDVKLTHLPEWTAKRQSVARQYEELLGGGPVATPLPAKDREHVWHVYAIRSRARDWLQEELKAAGVATNIHYPRPVHLQKVHADLGYGVGSFPVSEAFAAETLSLPMYPELERAQIEHVANAVREIAAREPLQASAA